MRKHLKSIVAHSVAAAALAAILSPFTAAWADEGQFIWSDSGVGASTIAGESFEVPEVERADGYSAGDPLQSIESSVLLSDAHPDGNHADDAVTGVVSEPIGNEVVVGDTGDFPSNVPLASDSVDTATSDGATLPVDGSSLLSVEAHVSNLGWMPSVGGGEVAGTTGRDLDLEALRIILLDSQYGDSSIEIRAHVENLGWMDWVGSGELAGTTGRAYAIEAVQIRLTGLASEQYDLWYCIHSADVGWLGWAKNGESAGSQGWARAAQAIEVMLLPKGSQAPSPLGNTSSAFMTPLLRYRAHVQDVGWQGYVRDGYVAGTTGRNLSLEALDVSLADAAGLGAIAARAHVQDIGWQDWSTSMCGTTGCGLPVEAICLKLEGEASSRRDIWYRVHSAEFGWLGWASNGDPAGSQGLARPVQAIEIRLQAKGSDAPGAENPAFMYTSLRYASHSAEIGWRSNDSFDANPDVILGVTGRALALQAFQLAIPGVGGTGRSIAYSAYVANTGWQDEVSDGQIAGTTGKNLPLEAVKIRLVGEIADQYDVWYRSHVANIGWIDWRKNGGSSGTQGLACPLEAVEIAILPKGSEAPGSQVNAFIEKPAISYSVCNERASWGIQYDNGAIAGSMDSGYLQAFQVRYSGLVVGSVSYRAKVSGAGWLDYVTDGGVAGSIGQDGSLQAIALRIEGDGARYYDIWYRVYLKGSGWTGWASNGASAGSSHPSRVVQAIQIACTGKGAPAPGSTISAYA